MCSIWLATWWQRCSIALWRTSIWRCMSAEETRIQAYLKKPAQITKCGPGFYDALGQTSPLHPSITQQTLKKPFLGSLNNFSVASDVQFQGFILNFIRLSSVDGQKSRQSVDLVQILWIYIYCQYSKSIPNSQGDCFYMSHTICPTGCAWKLWLGRSWYQIGEALRNWWTHNGVWKA